MAGHGGARNRSGPKPQMHSARSDLRDVRALKLPVAGYAGDFPPLSDLLTETTEREGIVWADLWRTPQAAQWARERWRWRSVAMYVRWVVRSEDKEATAATINAAQRLADQIGLTPAGLKENGWLIVADDSTSNPDQQEKQTTAKRKTAANTSGAARTNGGGKQMRSLSGRRD
ncbi:terminase small subunit [Gordonia phage Nyceirae]|uniref:Terminase small subunit n=1 Tax=Gordonia phage Nyceirae TaxID=1887651 RepID=A0A1C9EHY3_9CAUD|nr:terminase small subunit [Gordonia phage Nyceirae]AON97367.1 terminase small subunit [Gordonia phage Nyceirae]